MAFTTKQPAVGVLGSSCQRLARQNLDCAAPPLQSNLGVCGSLGLWNVVPRRFMENGETFAVAARTRRPANANTEGAEPTVETLWRSLCWPVVSVTGASHWHLIFRRFEGHNGRQP